jgi:hypothetical protein
MKLEDVLTPLCGHQHLASDPVCSSVTRYLATPEGKALAALVEAAVAWAEWGRQWEAVRPFLETWFVENLPGVPIPETKGAGDHLVAAVDEYLRLGDVR